MESPEKKKYGPGFPLELPIAMFVGPNETDVLRTVLDFAHLW